MISVKKINDIVVRPIKQENNQMPIKGEELFSEPYCNVFLCAKKKSGKSTVIYNVIKRCVGKDTKVHIFASTAFSDITYKRITDYLEGREIEYEIFTSIVEEGTNVIKQIVDELNHEAQEKEEEPVKPIIIEAGEKERPVRKPRKPKYLAPEHIFIFDDLGSTLRDKAIDSLLKVNRHYKSKVLISSQYLNDLSPQARLQLDYVLLFKGLPLEKLGQIYKDIDLSIDFETFLKYYEIATNAKFSFLYISVRDEKYRITFDREFS